MTKIWDIIIIGAGPAGAQAAYELSKLGYSVLILEKYNRDREKICGGGIFVQEVIDFGNIPDNSIEREIRDLVIHSIDYSKKFSLPEGMPSTYIVKRSIYDKYLQDIAISNGAIIKENEEVIRIYFDKNITVKTERNSYASKFLIDASGFNSIVANQTGILDNQRDDEKVSSYKVWLSFDDNTIETNYKKHVDFYFSENIIKDGYIWIFPKNNVLDVGIGTLTVNTKRKLVNIKKQLLDFINNHPILSKGKIVYQKGGMIPCKIYNNITQQNCVLIGDAAGISSPIHGGGIYYARKSAQIAAKHIDLYLKNNDYDGLNHYHNEIYNKIYAKEFKYDYKLRPFLGNDTLLNALLKSNQTDKFFIELFTGTNNHKNIYKNIMNISPDILSDTFNIKISSKGFIPIPEFYDIKHIKKPLIIVSYCLKDQKCPVKKYSNICINCGKCAIDEITKLCNEKEVKKYIVTSRDDYIHYMNEHHTEFDSLISISCNYIIKKIAYLTHLVYGISGVCVPLYGNTCQNNHDYIHSEENKKVDQTRVDLNILKKIIHAI